MVGIHLSQHIDSVAIETQIRVFDNTEGIQLMSQRLFSKNELCRIGTIKAVDAVGTTNAVLE
jgi:hypothetical protein